MESHARTKYLTAYIDESGSDLGEKTFVLAGYADLSQKWISFAMKWAKILEAPRSVEYFRSAEAANLQGQFKGFCVNERDAKVKRLIQQICEYRQKMLTRRLISFALVRSGC